MFPVLVVLFLVVPLAELWVIVAVADGLGIVPTLVLLLLVSLVGAWMVRIQGFGALRRIQQSLSRGDLPGTDLVDGGLIVLAGALLLTPGFLTDTVGLLLLFPPTRAVGRAYLAKRFQARVTVMGFGPGASGDRSGESRGAGGTGPVVDVEGHERTGTGGDAEDEGPPSGPPRLAP